VCVRLHPRFAVALVVDDDHGEIRRLLHADPSRASESHQHLAIAGDHHDAALGLREREAEADHCRRPIAPHSGKLRSASPAAVMSHAVEPRPAITKRSFPLFK